MKAILRNNRKVIVDVVPMVESPNGRHYKDRIEREDCYCTYYEEELEFIEYYGG